MVEHQLFTCSFLTHKPIKIWPNYIFLELEGLERVSYVLSQ